LGYEELRKGLDEKEKNLPSTRIVGTSELPLTLRGLWPGPEGGLVDFSIVRLSLGVQRDLGR